MKYYRWIDKFNYKNNFNIIRKYSAGIAAGKSKYYYYHRSFFGKYLWRLLLVFLSALLLKKSTYRTFVSIVKRNRSPFYSPNKYSNSYIRAIEFFSTLFGYRYFTNPRILPLLKDEEILKSQLTIHSSKNSLVSIIIPVYNHLDYTYNCLKSIQANVSEDYAFEILIIDDCSTDSTSIFFEENVKGVRYIRNQTNQGYLRNCNSAVDSCSGELICFLNNDVQVLPGWIESLVRTLKLKNIGAVGSKLVYPNGLLQEAGSMIFNDASATNYGRNNNPDHPDYNYMRQVDYCSAASLMVRKKDFGELKRFDNQYEPAYYEDTDICMAITNLLKKKVIYQPLSCVIHFEGISSGTDIENDPIKNFQKINKHKFQKKWEKELLTYEKVGNGRLAITKFTNGKTILFVDDAVPAADQESGSNRLFQILKIVKSLGYHVCFLPNNGDKRGKYFELLVYEGIQVFYKFPNRKKMLKILEEKAPYFDFVWICKPSNNSVVEFLFQKNTKIKRIYDTVDLHYLRLQREGELMGDKKLLLSAMLTKTIELNYALKADATITVTNEEQILLNSEHIQHVFVVPNVHEANTDLAMDISFEGREGLLFIGGFNHTPNVDAVKWLIREIMPAIWEVDPTITVTLLGSNPTQELLTLREARVFIPGYISDVSEYFYSRRVFVAPLRFGAGMKGKIGQSLEYSLPIVSTSIGIEGMNLVDGVHVLIANDTDIFAKKILELYESSTLWNKLHRNSLEPLEELKPDQVESKLKTFLNSLE